MRRLTRLLMTAAFLLSPVPSLLAQTAVDPSAHWEGAIQVPNMEVRVEVDLATNSKGKLAGTFSNQSLKGFPFGDVAVNGRSVRLLLKAGSGGGTFEGTISADGKWLSGDFITAEGGFSVPFTLARSGDARIAPPARSAPIGKELDGSWNGTLEIGGRKQPLVLTMSNQQDGTSIGTIVSVDEGLEIPIGITQEASNLTLDVKAAGGTYIGALSKEGTELVGTYSQGALVAPLTFRLARP